MNQADLNKVLSKQEFNPFIKSSQNSNEDAYVIDLSAFMQDDLNNYNLVLSCDFISPVCDDAYMYGKIAAANALSDIYAMGARVFSCMNLISFNEEFSNDVLAQIIQGLNDKSKEANAILSGGHSVKGSDILAGLSVNGICKKDKHLSNNSAKYNDVLIATKKLGTSTNILANKADLLNAQDLNYTLNQMQQLNSFLPSVKINACTDITGFGLIGHLSEMLNDDISIELDSSSLEFLPSVMEFAKIGLISANAYCNKEQISVKIKSFIDDDILLYAPETSGGLIFSVNEKDVNKCLDELNKANFNAFAFAKINKKQDFDIFIY
ncbi:selenide, water dikinase SelD [Campylobacter canadensis]|uniref:selenide, water dikinase SelD n=1 Tax=Campylobacter canadensis TaxID=449520 RepID=UPI001CCF947D|nr:selenide, water dikinase SelD [Campylobacter canadensis]